ncbi:uncharacterized protein LOC129678107 [Psammomys obesus]|uniref:uncharacterized protein LOC129678107 n=1 Tax=Psammomys obesus TaxID=48139 RepID=UPI0024531473|nr:uncharacterized protein LOC129678107 [Psammomys obesus]
MSLILTLILILSGVQMDLKVETQEIRWGILSTFPRPMPVMYDAQVFPRFFTTNDSIGLPYLPMSQDIAPIPDNNTQPNNGSLCFTTNQTHADSCIKLGNFSYAKLGKETIRNRTSSANATVLFGWWPQHGSSYGSNERKHQPQYAPFCTGRHADSSIIFPWTGCQSRRAHLLENGLFTFSPLEGYGNYTEMSPWNYPTNPFNIWLLCGVGGSCTDLSPMVTILGGATATTTLLANVRPGSISATELGGLKSVEPTPVCVWPPFVWTVCNYAGCFYALCWNASEYDLATVARMPRFLPIPVRTSSSLALFRQKRDFGITAAIVAIIATAAVGASLTISALALNGQVATAHTLNNLSASVSEAIDIQASMNNQLKGGLMIVNQRIDLVQEQLEILWQLAQLGCETTLPGICVTSVPYNRFTRAANLSIELSRLLQSNWSAEFDETIRKLRLAIVQINSTRLDVSITQGLFNWVSSALSYFKEWVGVGMFGVTLFAGLLLCFWLLCRFKRQQHLKNVAMVQAMLAVEQGASPQVWLNLLNR